MTPKINFCANFQQNNVERLTKSSIKESVASLYGIVDLIGAGLVGDLPQTETDLRHFITSRLELDRWNVDHPCGLRGGKSANGSGRRGYVRGR